VRTCAIVVSAALLISIAGCGGGSSDEETPAGDTTTSVDAGTAETIVGEWERDTTCAELVRGLRQAGIGSRTAEFVAGNGFVPGVRSADQLDDPSRPCKGAVPRKHSHFFTADGRFGSRDWNGEDVDDGTYRVKDNNLTISKEFPDVTFRYQIEGDTITFAPLIPDKCETFRCAWAVSVAYPGKKWTRIGY
jgi:hypothetical protein